MPARPVNPLLRLDRRLVIAHRGAPTEAPENTLESFRLAVAQRADALELDVHLSADGVPVVVHDATLHRTTNQTGAVAGRSLGELRAADAGYHFTADGGRIFPWRGRGVELPTLDAVVREFADTPLLIELKTAAAQAAAWQVVEAAGATARCVPASAHHAALSSFRRTGVPYSASRREIAQLYFGSAVGLRRAVDYATVSVPLHFHGLPVPTSWFIRAAHRLGCAVHVWTVDCPATARRLWDRGVTGIVTNVPALMVEARDEERASRGGRGRV